MAMDCSSDDNDWKENSYAPGTGPDDFKPHMTDEEIGKLLHDIVHEPTNMDTGRVENILLTKQTSEPSFLEDSSAHPGVCGLRNLGNTCYMNAGIQALLSVPQLTEYFTNAVLSGLEEPDSKELDRVLEQVDTLLYNAYTKLTRSVWSGRYSYLTPAAFKAFIGEAFHPFRGYKAHDCQEFMGVFLDHINAVLRTERLRHSSLREESDFEPSTKSQKLEKENSVSSSVCDSDTPTVVESAFRGMFSTKVTCCECRHEIVLEEPFFFLSVPLPRGFERQFKITWCPLYPIHAETDPLAPDGTTVPVTECLVTVFKNQNVADLKKALLQLLALNLSPADIALVEVSGRAPQRLLQDSLVVSYVKDDFRSVYAIEMKVTPTTNIGEEVSSPMTPPIGVSEAGANPVKKPLISSINGVVSSSSEAEQPTNPQETPAKENNKLETPVNPASLSYHTCAICLEDIQDTDLMVHPACGCTLCETCLSLNCSRVTESGDTPCPVCSEATTTDSFIPYPQLHTYRPETKRIPAFVIFRYRLPTDPSGSNLRLNKFQPFSHPCLMEVDNHLKGYQLYGWVIELPRPALFRRNESFEINLTDDLQDTRRVMPDFSDVIIRPSDRIYVDFGPISDYVIDCSDKKKDHVSLVEEKREPLTLANCLDAFSQSEILGPENMWFCPMCQDNKTVEKFIRIKELPTTLIVHLKRFAFHGSQGDKIDAPVKFPFSAADFSSYVFSSTPPDNSVAQVPEYNLISCVCHFGGLHGGHYTAYAKHPTTHEWLHYNDHKVETMNPEGQTDTAKEAYILIYQRRGDSFPRLQPTVELAESEEEGRLVKLIVERIQREEAATLLYGPASAPVIGPSNNPFLKDTYMIDFEEFSADYYPDNPNTAQVSTQGAEQPAEGMTREVYDSSGTLDGAVSTCDSSHPDNNIPDKTHAVQESPTDKPNSINIVWDHIV